MSQRTSYIIKSKTEFLIIVGIYVSIFLNSYVLIKDPVEFQIGYLMYIILLPGFVRKYPVNKNLLYIFLILLASGLVNIFLGNNTAALFFKVFIGLFLAYFFYYYVILEFDYNIEQLFKWYLKGAYIVSLLGVYQFICFQLGFVWGYRFGHIFNKWGFAPGGIFGIRVNSIFSEPTHLAAVLSAAFFVSIYNLFMRETFGLSRFQSIVIIVIYILSFSGLGQMGIFIALVFLAINYGLIRYTLLLIPASIILFNVLYNNVEEFRGRLDGIVTLFSGKEQFQVGKIHGSSFILYNNFKVAKENFKINFVFGTGIGSHPVAFGKFSEAKKIKQYGFNLNSADANSMLLRLISETGLFGVLIFFYIIVKCYVKRDPADETYHWLISNSILIMILLNLFRQGHYFLNGFPFFVLLYYYNSISYRNYLEEKIRPIGDNLIKEL
jgi:hypothetical protein